MWVLASEVDYTLVTERGRTSKFLETNNTVEQNLTFFELLEKIRVVLIVVFVLILYLFVVFFYRAQFSCYLHFCSKEI